MKLSVLVPAYNEASTIVAVVKAISEVDYPCDVQVVVVDDGSLDGTADILAGLASEDVIVHRHVTNRGKGAAIRTASELADGDYMLICDADLEYSPLDIPALLGPVLAGEADVVFGTRKFGSHTAYSFWYVLGNKVVTMAANVLFDCWISDLETCFKLLPLSLYRSLDIRSRGFGMEAEVTAKLLKRGVRPYEVPISYRARSRAAGKKLTWRDGVEALWILARVRAKRGCVGR